MPDLQTLIILILCPLAWVLLDLLRKILADRGRAMPLTCLLLVYQLPFLPLWLWVQGSWSIGAGYWWPALASVAINLVANVAYMQAIRLSPISVTLPLLALTPAFSSLVGVPILGEVPLPLQWFGIALVVAGALVLNSNPEEVGRWRFLKWERGALYMLFVAICWSLTPALDKLALRHASGAMHALVLSLGIVLGLLGLLVAKGRLSELRVSRSTTACWCLHLWWVARLFYCSCWRFNGCGWARWKRSNGAWGLLSLCC
jgi:drug/metabolite transporter (DMT)-like permease